MNCQECESLFDEMIDRRVKEPTRQRMELHLSRCGTCRSRLEHRKRSHTLMFRALNGADVRLHLPNGFADRLVAECRIEPKRPFFPALPRWALIAASLAIIAGFVFAANVAIDAVTAATDDGDRPATALPSANYHLPTTIHQLPSTNYQLPTNYQLQTTPGETTMTRKKAAAAVLASAMAAALLTEASGDACIISGDPEAAATVGSSSASSATSSLTSGTLADGYVHASELEARYRTVGESAVMALRSDKFNATIIIFK